MRFVSNRFVEMQDEIIRAPFRNMYLYVGTDNGYPHNAPGGSLNDLGFDTSVAPVVAPKYCRNTRFYSVLGENVEVDNVFRICAPDGSGGLFAEPNQLVPYGVTVYADANEEVIIGNPTVALNFTNIRSRLNIVFSGVHIPHKLVVEWYDFSSNAWKVSGTYTGTGSSWWFRYNNFGIPENRFTRFKISAPTAGRFQLAFVMEQWSIENDAPTVIFDRTSISKVNISENIDFTSQSLPSYDMTVDCLDINGSYAPETEYWKKQFKENTPVLFSVVSARKEGYAEYIDLFFGKLVEQPDYEQGKIKFKIAVDWKKKKSVRLMPETDNTLVEGDPVAGTSFASIISTNELFDSYDVFPDITDRINSVCNKYGVIEAVDARQLIANALGCYIKSDINTIELENANAIQYKPICDYLTRYDQVKYTLESKPKVGKISIERGNNTLAADYVDIETADRKIIGDDEHRYVNFEFILPMDQFGKTALVNAQSTESDATVTLFDSVSDFYIDDNGEAHAFLPFTSDYYTTAKPIVRFYKVDNNTVQETETLDNEANEVYENSNDLITNTYVASKVKRVAHLVSDISNQYEVDVVQDLRYEVGDVIRLETEKNVYKTCVITGLKFNLPGCNGHLTCRKIFSLLDSENVVDEPVGLSVSFGITTITVTEASEVGSVVGIMNKGATTYIFVLGVNKFDKTISGVTTQEDYNGSLIDLNGHEWKFAYYSVPSSTEIITAARKVLLPDYDYTRGATEGAFGAISLLKALYNEQEMSAPVDYNCEWNET